MAFKSKAKAAIGTSFRRLQHLILQLQAGLGAEVWGKTVLLAVTEFGRTVAEKLASFFKNIE